MAKNIKSPIEILVTITNNDDLEKIEVILNNFQSNFSIAMLGNGTINKEISDLFGFGFIDKTITTSIINTKNIDIIFNEITTSLAINTDKSDAIIFTIPLNSIEKNTLKTFGVNLEEIL